MIGRLRGLVLEKRPPQLLLDVGGVGYELEAPLSAFFDLPGADTPVSPFTHLVVREDAQLLYGFRSRPERELFRALIRVNGVGPKLALALLSGIDAPELVRCIQEGDVTSLTRLPGVGKKTAERLIVEMRDRIAEAFGKLYRRSSPGPRRGCSGPRGEPSGRSGGGRSLPWAISLRKPAVPSRRSRRTCPSRRSFAKP